MKELSEVKTARKKGRKKRKETHSENKTITVISNNNQPSCFFREHEPSHIRFENSNPAYLLVPLYFPGDFIRIKQSFFVTEALFQHTRKVLQTLVFKCSVSVSSTQHTSTILNSVQLASLQIKQIRKWTSSLAEGFFPS